MYLVFLRDGVTLWVKCVFLFPLISIEGLLELLVSVPSAGLPGPVPVLAACSLGGLHRLPLCYSSLLCVASFCSVGFLFLVSFLDSTCWPFSPPFLLWLSLVLVARCFLGPFLPLEFHFAVWLVLQSLSGLLCSFGLAPFYFWVERSFHLSRVFCYLS